MAHNWNELSRFTRLVGSLLPLGISAALGVGVLRYPPMSTTRREGVGAWHAFSVGAAVALVSQTSHLGERFDEFVLTWSLLPLPIVYVSGAISPHCATHCAIG